MSELPPSGCQQAQTQLSRSDESYWLMKVHLTLFQGQRIKLPLTKRNQIVQQQQGKGPPSRNNKNPRQLRMFYISDQDFRRPSRVQSCF